MHKSSAARAALDLCITKDPKAGTWQPTPYHPAAPHPNFFVYKINHSWLHYPRAYDTGHRRCVLRQA